MRKLFFVLLVAFIPGLLIALENNVQLKDIKIIGNERVSNKTIDVYVKLKVGDYVNDDDIDLVIKDLYKTKLFSSVNAYIDEERNLIIKIQENRLINRIILQGNKLFNNKELLANVIQSKPLNIFTEAKLQSDLMNLITTYRNNGKVGAKVEHELIMLDDNRVNLIFKISEGRTSKVSSVRFIGNKNFSEDELREVIKTHNTNIFSKLFKAISRDTNHYSPQYLLINTELLDRFYSSKGYINNSIQPIVEVDNNHQAHVTFLIDEGKQYLFGNNSISIENELSLEKEILQFITEENNQVFNRIKVHNTIEKISQYLNEKGYVFAKVNPEYVQHDSVVDVIYKIFPDKKIYINQITIDGNHRTLDQVIRNKLSVAEGDVYNILEIQKSRRKLLGSDFFSAVNIDSYAVSESEVDLHLNVKEKGTGTFSLAGGASFPGGPFIKTDIKEPNLFGSGMEFAFALEKSKYSFLADIEITENNFNDSDTSLGAGVFYETHTNPNTDFKAENYGFSTKLSYKVIENLSNSLRYFYKYNHIYERIDGGNEYKEEPSKNIISTVGYTLTYNKLDNLYSPRDGYLLRLGQDVSGLGGNVNFLKSECLAFVARPILTRLSDDIILRLKLATGYVFSYTDQKLGADQHFFKGGNEIRGFAFSGIGPRRKDGDELALGGKFYFNAIQQIDFPLLDLYDKAGIKGSLFVDYATLFDVDCGGNRCGQDYYNDKLLRISTGFGFSMPSPFGRLRLDFGFPIVKEEYDKLYTISFSIEAGV